jgi:GUN4-like/NACHT domain
MPEEQKPSEPKTEEKDSIVPAGMAPWKQELGKVLWAVVTSGAVTGGGVMAALNGTKLPEIAMGMLGGGLFTGAGAIGYAYVDPIARRTKKKAGDAGDKTVEAIDWTAEQLWAKATQMPRKYGLAQAEECEGYRPEAVRQYPGLGKPMLRDVFVPLMLIGQGKRAGYTCDEVDVNPVGSLQDNLTIWKLLKRAQTSPEFRRIVLLAHGGFGKTTLLRHVAYTLGRGEQGRYEVKERVPILLLLREYKKQFAQDVIPALPDLIETVHLPSLGRSAELKMPTNWAKDVLDSGQAIVMLDGFDELNLEDRSKAARWLNQQMKRYSKCVFIVTSRPKAFNNQPVNEQLDVSLAIWVKDFGIQEQSLFVEKWYRCQERIAAGEKKETDATTREAQRETKRLMAQINDRPELKALAINPLLLNMIVTFHRLKPWGNLPVLRSGLYREICQLQIVDRPEARDLETVLPGVDTLGVLQKLALEMMQRGIQRISVEDLVELVTGYLRSERTQTIEVKQFINDVVDVTEMLVDQGEEYDFSHLTFQEYLTAAEIDRSKQEALLYDKLTDDRWKNVILYYVGLVRNPSGLLQRLLDRGNTALVTECLKEAKQVEPSIKAAIEALNQQVKNDRYTQLDALLKAGKWKEADQETSKVMLQVSGQEERGFLMPDDLTNFPCEDLVEIDRLWVEASNGHFGFSVQKKIWEECGSPMDYNDDYEKFMEKVGWRSGGEFVRYSDFKFSPSHSLAGELPGGGGWWKYNRSGVSFLAQRLVNCSITAFQPKNKN